MTGASGIAKTVQEKRRLLRSRFLLRNLSQSDLERIAAAATCARFGRHEKIFRRGESETNLMIMVSGRVKLSATSTDGRQLVSSFTTILHWLPRSAGRRESPVPPFHADRDGVAARIHVGANRPQRH